MFKPVYALTTKLQKNINEIERLYGRLEGITVPQHLLLNLERNNLIQSAYISNSIEGNPLSQAEVTNLLLNERVPVNRDEKEVVNYFQLLKELPIRAKEPLTLSTMKGIHEQLLAGVNEKIRGEIRDKRVVVGNYIDNQIVIKHDPPYHTKELINQALQDLITWKNEAEVPSILKIGIFHHEFVYIHPFEDGNGRACRLLTSLLFLRHGYLINKYFVLDDYYDIDRQLYSDSLHTADSGDKTQWLEYFTDGVKYSLQSALGKIELGLTKMTFDIRPTPKEQEVLKIIQQYKEINSSDLVKEFGVSRQQAFNLLKSLTEKGFVEKKGSTKSSYYILK